jgi:hypothetical protein
MRAQQCERSIDLSVDPLGCGSSRAENSDEVLALLQFAVNGLP